MLNCGTAFTDADRDRWKLHGLLPAAVESMEHRADRVLAQLRACESDIARYVLLAGLLERDERLFYAALQRDLAGLMPVIYTPTVGRACEEYGHILGRARGMYLPITLRGRLREVLRNWPWPNAHFVVVTDGSRILGLGDLGANGMGIPVGKLALYTAAGGVDPALTIPITLDVGCDDPAIREDPYYSGLRRPRAPEREYLAFLDEFVAAVQDVFPDSCIQFEDFSFGHAELLLERYKEQVCCFNDDIQGTAAVALAGILAGCRAKGEAISEQRVLFLGAGGAACGIAELIAAAMKAQGASSAHARRSIRMFDEHGLLTRERTDLAPFQVPYGARTEPTDDLVSAIDDFRPTALVGVSTAGGAFNDRVLRHMARWNTRPIIMPLSNPTDHSECTALAAYEQTDGTCLFASGSPFPVLDLGGATVEPAQGNNVYIFPAIGLAVMATRADRITDEVFLRAAESLAEQVPASLLDVGVLYPDRQVLREALALIAIDVSTFIFDAGLARIDRPDDIEAHVRSLTWDPMTFTG